MDSLNLAWLLIGVAIGLEIAVVIIWTDTKTDNAVPTKEKIMTKRDIVHIYPHQTGKLKNTWDWKREDAYNGNIVATSHNQGYESADEAERMAKKINRKTVFVRDE